MPSMMPWGTRRMKRRGLRTQVGGGSRGMALRGLTEFSSPSDAVVSQVLDELGLSLTDELSSECFQPRAPTPPRPPSWHCCSHGSHPLSLQTSPPLEAPSVWLLVARKQKLQPLPWWMPMQTWRKGLRTCGGTNSSRPRRALSLYPSCN